MYTNVPNVASASVAVAAGTATVTVLAAPGVGNAIRVVGGRIGTTRPIVAATTIDFGLTGVLPIQFANSSGGATSFSINDIPEPGIQLASNTALVFTITASAAAGAGEVVIYYFVDVVL